MYLNCRILKLLVLIYYMVASVAICSKFMLNVTTDQITDVKRSISPSCPQPAPLIHVQRAVSPGAARDKMKPTTFILCNILFYMLLCLNNFSK